MQLTYILQLALLAATQINAAPVAEPEAQTPNAANELVKRAVIKPVSCGRKLNTLDSKTSTRETQY